MKKSVSQQLLEYLQQNHGVFSAGALQRMDWHNENGTLAIPKSVSRRLQELAEDGKIERTEINGHTHYSGKPIVKEVKPVYVIFNGKRMSVQDL